MRKTRDSKPFFLAFATVCGVVPGVVGYCVMQLTSSRTEQLEARLRQTARPESLVRLFLLFSFLATLGLCFRNLPFSSIAIPPFCGFLLENVVSPLVLSGTAIPRSCFSMPPKCPNRKASMQIRE